MGHFRTSMRLVAYAVAILSAPYASASNQSDVEAITSNSEPGVVGTWRLMRYEDRAKDGTVSQPYGERPSGYFVYDPTGHLSIHIMRHPPVPPLASGDWKRATQAEKVNAYDGYVGYFGTYQVDREKHMLRHIVEGALNPMYTNTLQLRPYTLKGDVLIIEMDDPKDGTRYYRELHRVR